MANLVRTRSVLTRPSEDWVGEPSHANQRSIGLLDGLSDLCSDGVYPRLLSTALTRALGRGLGVDEPPRFEHHAADAAGAVAGAITAEAGMHEVLGLTHAMQGTLQRRSCTGETLGVSSCSSR